MSQESVVRELRGIRDRNVILKALIAGVLALAVQAPAPLAAEMEALVTEAQAVAQDALAEVSSLLSDLA